MNHRQHALVGRCESLAEAAGDAISWLAEVRGGSPKLDREADSITQRIRQARNLFKRLSRAASNPVSVGFFGLSQAGKSYVISALGADARGELDTILGSERLGFIQHVNPAGGGKEATGLVTRFTQTPIDAPPEFPIRLELFSETDLVKLLGNSFYNDFDHEQFESRLGPEEISGVLRALEGRRRAYRESHLDEDAIVDLQDYFQRRFPKATAGLDADFWPTAVELTPYLGLDARAELFSLLWGGIQEITNSFTALARDLATMGHARFVYAPISALVSKDPQGSWSQAASIMNVDTLERLGASDGDSVSVLSDTGRTDAVRIARSALAALTAELVFQLAEPSQTQLTEHCDLLDFPGYRGRLKLVDIREARTPSGAGNPVAQLILRGKVAFLFERYTENQEMNALVVCAPSNKQVDVEDLGTVLDAWVRATQGADPQTRSHRPAGLIWALTMFDTRLTPNPQHTPDLIRQGWQGMMKSSLLERFGKYSWIDEWSPGAPFDRVTLVRKPGLAPAVIDTQAGREIRLQPSQVDWLQGLEDTFCEDGLVCRHIAQPSDAWDAMLALNDGGVHRLASLVRSVTSLDAKLDRIAEQLDGLALDLAQHTLGRFYNPTGMEEVADRARMADAMAAALAPLRDQFAAFLQMLQPQRAHLHSVYLRSSQEEATGESAAALAHDPWGTPDDRGDNAPRATASARRYARAVVSDWVGRLRGLPDSAALMSHLGLERGALEDIVETLVVGADRLQLEQSLIAQFQDSEAQAGVRGSLLAPRQALVAAITLGDFVANLGQSASPEVATGMDSSNRLFSPQAEIAPRTQPDLPAQMTPFTRMYKDDWVEALRRLCIGNVGHSSQSDIPAEANVALGAILDRLRQTQSDATDEFRTPS